jgi:DNA polymerase-3 subunit epsilon
MRILFFDTETTGLPKDWKAPVEQLDNWPRLVQIAWQVFNQEGDLLEEHEYIIKPVGFIIPLEASAVHKITTEKALETGVDLLTVLNVFRSSVNGCGLLVAHNYSYDYNIMGSELLRNGLENSLKDKDYICTKEASTDFCKIPGPYAGFKWPKLEELYDILFGESFNAHDALDDIKATARCFWELYSKKVITLNVTLPGVVELKINDIGNHEFNKFKGTRIFKNDRTTSRDPWVNQLFLFLDQKRELKIKGWTLNRVLHSTIFISDTEIEKYRQKQSLPGKIYIKDQLTPFAEKSALFNMNNFRYSEMHNPDGSLGGAGSDSEHNSNYRPGASATNVNGFPGMKKNGQQIYRRYIYDASSEKQDEIIQYNNYQEVDEYIIEDINTLARKELLTPEYRVCDDGNTKSDQELYPGSGFPRITEIKSSSRRLNEYLLLGISSPLIWFWKGVYAYKENSLDSAIQYYNFALKEIKSNKDYSYYKSLDDKADFLMKETALNDLGNIHFKQEKYDGSLEYYDQCIKSFPEFEINNTFNRLLLINSYYYWAYSIVKLLNNTYVLREEVSKGIRYLKKAEKIIEHFDNTNQIKIFYIPFHYRHKVSLIDINKLVTILENKITENKF